MEKKINVPKPVGQPLRVTVVKGDNWDSIKAVDFGGAEVEFQGQTSTVHPFSGNASVTSITNATIVNDTCRTLFANNSGLTYVNVTATCGNSGITRMFDSCPNIQTVIISAPNATKLATNREEHFIGGTHNVPYSISGQFDSLVTLYGISGFSGQTKLADFTVKDNTLPNCTDIQSGFIGTSIKTINLTLPKIVGGTLHAFYNCKSLTSATVNMPAQTRFGGNMFQNCSALTEVYLTVSKSFTGTPSGNMCAGCNNLAYFEVVGNGTFTSWTQSDFSITSSAPCQAYRYLDDLGNGSMRLVFTSQARPEPQPTIGWDVVTEFGTPEYTIELNDSMLRPISECLHLSSANQTKLDNYLSAKAYNTDKAYIIYADNRLGSRGGSSVAGVTYRITGDNAGAYGTYGIILIHQDGSSAGYYDVYVNDTKVVSRAYGYGRLTVQGYTNNGRSLDLYNTNLEAEVTLPDVGGDTGSGGVDEGVDTGSGGVDGGDWDDGDEF